MKTKILSIIFILITISSISAKEVLVVGTYDSFSAEWGPGPVIETEFEKNCNCDVQYVSTSQAGTLANEIFLKDKDVILGVEMHEFDYTSENWNIYDYGYFSFIYNEETLKDIPNSFEELINQKNLKIVVQDPRTSPVGLGLLRWMKLTHPDNFPTILKKFNNNVLTYTPGWSEAYGIFLEGKADLVLSYSTSPFYHQEYEDEYKYKSIEFTGGHLATKEIVYVRPDSEKQKLGKEFIEFMMRDNIQKIIAQMNIMYPARENDNNIPDKMRELKKPKEIEYDNFLEAEPLIKIWLEVVAS
jgi:ABC transporter periplasmic binding protein, thiB subfamily